MENPQTPMKLRCDFLKMTQQREQKKAILSLSSVKPDYLRIRHSVLASECSPNRKGFSARTPTERLILKTAGVVLMVGFEPTRRSNRF